MSRHTISFEQSLLKINHMYHLVLSCALALTNCACVLQHSIQPVIWAVYVCAFTVLFTVCLAAKQESGWITSRNT
jgi:hypothetical protein